jgi:hypothetical protein
VRHFLALKESAWKELSDFYGSDFEVTYMVKKDGKSYMRVTNPPICHECRIERERRYVRCSRCSRAPFIPDTMQRASPEAGLRG